MTISGSDTPTVLIADASPAKREMLAKRLQGQYHVLQADSEEAALELLRSRSGDIVLVLLGLTPSGPEGVSVLTQMKTLGLLDCVPVIAILEDDAPQSVRRAYEMGATDCLRPDTDALVLLKRIQNAIRLFSGDKVNVSQMVSLAEQLKKQNSRLESVDDLTGCNNLSAFFREAEHILRANDRDTYALWYCNIKQFKLINNRFGFNIGDYVLRFWATQIQLDLLPAETFGRMSGDHFLVLTRFRDTEQLDTRFREWGKAVSDCLGDLNINYDVEIVAGVYLIYPGQISRLTLNMMMDRANLAQQSIKRRNGSHWSLYDAKMLESQLRRAEISKHLTDALHNGEIIVYLQPQYDFSRQLITGAEVLCRWEHKTLGWLSPGDFIPVLEHTNQIFELDSYIWRRACHTLSQLRALGIRIPLSINISRSDVCEEGLVDTIVSLTREYGLTPQDLHLEITESAFTEDSQILRTVIGQLRSLGYRVEMDDFGSGYSSLTMLRDLPIDLLKLDAGFVREGICDKRGSVILRSVIEMAKTLGLSIIAEGIESLEQAQYLLNMGCRLMQGYYFAHPMLDRDFILYLKQLPSDMPDYACEDGCAPAQTEKTDEDVLLSAQRSEQEAAALLKQIVDASNCGIFAYTLPQRRILTANQEAYRLMGWHKNEVVLGINPYSKISGQIDPEDMHAIHAAAKTLVKPGDAFTVNYRLRCSGKACMNVQLTSKLLEIPTGEHMVLSTLVDITDKAKTEDSLAASLQTFHIASQETGETVFVFDIADRTVCIEGSGNGLFSESQTVEDVPYGSVNNGTVAQRSRDDYIRLYRKMIDGARSASAILHRITIDGRPVVVRVNLQAMLDDHNEPTGKVAGVITDITTLHQQRQTIEDLAATGRAAQMDLRRHQEVIQALASDYFAIYLVDLDADQIEIIRTNDTLLPQVAERIRQAPAFQAAVASYVSQYVYPEDQDRLLHDFSASVLRRRLHQESIFFLRYRRMGPGVVQYAEFKMVDVSDAQDGSRAVMAIRNVDGSVRRELRQQAQLKEALVQAQYASFSKSRFLSNISHDIRTPLNVISGYSSIASNHLEDTRRVSECLKKVLQASSDLQDRITDILDMAQLEDGAPKIRCEPVDLIKALQGPLSITQSKAAAKHQLFAVNHSSISQEAVSTDALKLNQILMSILDNAVKYTPNGGCIRFTASQEETASADCFLYSFRVEDNGIGMSEEFQQHLFEPFEQENVSGSRMGGSGLGLAIAKRIADAMGAQIQVQSRQGVGTCVTVTLKLHSVPLPRLAAPMDADAPIPAGTRILVVEDNPLNMDIARDLLLEAGFEVDTAENGAAALQMLETSPPNCYRLVLMDVIMPVMDGYEASMAIRSSSRKDLSKLPIIAFTANTLQEDLDKAIECGISDYLFKPIDPEKLVKKIRCWL